MNSIGSQPRASADTEEEKPFVAKRIPLFERFRTNVFVEYCWAPTFYHRLHPLTKLVLFMVLSLASAFYSDIVFLAVLGLVLVVLAKVVKVPWFWFSIPLFVIFAQTLTFGPLSFTMWRSELYTHYPQDILKITLIPVTGPGFPVFGELRLTIGSLLWLSSLWLRVFAGIAAGLVLFFTTSPAEVASWLSTIGAPAFVSFIIMAGFRFISYIQRKIVLIMQAQSLRGVIFASRNPAKVIRSFAPISIPLMRNMLSMTDEVTIATQIRAFDTRRKVSPYRPLKLTLKDKIIIVTSVAVGLVGFYLLLNYGIGSL